MSETPESQARKNIDRQLEACGWVVQDRDQVDISASPGVAIREFPLKCADETDYLLYAAGKAFGVVEWATGNTELRQRLREMPQLVPGNPWSVQFRAINGLEDRAAMM